MKTFKQNLPQHNASCNNVIPHNQICIDTPKMQETDIILEKQIDKEYEKEYINI